MKTNTKSQPKTLLMFISATLLIFSSGCTKALWETNNPNERSWISADKITENELKAKDLDYESFPILGEDGYLVEKSDGQKFKDYTIRLLATPVTLTVDVVAVAATYAFWGVMLFCGAQDGQYVDIDDMFRGW